MSPKSSKVRTTSRPLGRQTAHLTVARAQIGCGGEERCGAQNHDVLAVCQTLHRGSQVRQCRQVPRSTAFLRASRDRTPANGWNSRSRDRVSSRPSRIAMTASSPDGELCASSSSSSQARSRGCVAAGSKPARDVLPRNSEHLRPMRQRLGDELRVGQRVGHGPGVLGNRWTERAKFSVGRVVGCVKVRGGGLWSGFRQCRIPPDFERQCCAPTSPDASCARAFPSPEAACWRR